MTRLSISGRTALDRPTPFVGASSAHRLPSEIGNGADDRESHLLARLPGTLGSHFFREVRLSDSAESANMRDIPIIFSGLMVRALLDGRKTMTRRLAWRGGCFVGNRLTKPEEHITYHNLGSTPVPLSHPPSPWQRVKPGDRLWVRESLDRRGEEGIGYMADGSAHPHALWRWARDTIPSIHMPRWASRLTLTVTATKIEPLLHISAADAEAEGLCKLPATGRYVIGKGDQYFGLASADPRQVFRWLWEDLHGIAAWDNNPEVVALTFTVARQNIDAANSPSVSS